MNKFNQSESALISFIIPAYNASKTLKKCVKSVLNQKYKKIEIIIINDGSCDDTEVICKKYLNVDARVKYFYQKNSGVSCARNLGITKSKGSIICFLDSDDYLDDNYCEYIANNFVVNGLLVFGFNYVFDNKKEIAVKFENNFSCKQEKSLEMLIENDKFSSGLMNKAFDANVIRNNNIMFEENILYGEDLLFCFDYLLISEETKVIPDRLYYYFKHYDSATGKINNLRKLQIRCTDLLAIEKCIALTPPSYTKVLNMLYKRISKSGTFCYRLSVKMNRPTREIEDLKNLVDPYIRKYMFQCGAFSFLNSKDSFLVLFNRYFPRTCTKFYGLFGKD